MRRNRHRGFHGHGRNQHHLFIKNHKYFKYIRIAMAIVDIIILLCLFAFLGLEGISKLIIVFFVVKGIFEFVFISRLEKRVINPVEKLKAGVEEVSKGNYDVNIQIMGPNAIEPLVDAFNNMASQLKEGEETKLSYEKNRKELIANISHDLKTPITSIQGYAEGLLSLEAQDREKSVKYATVIANNANYMNKLIDDLFLFSKLDLDKLPFDFEKVPANLFFEDLMEEMSFEYGEGFSYVNEIPLEYHVYIDRKRIQQVFHNIFDNAVKYGKKEGLFIRVTASNHNENLIVTIENNGAHIPNEQLEHIFEQFYRVEKERTKDLKSTGLGLAIVKQLLKAHNGTIRAINKEVDVVQFTLTIPIVQEGIAYEGNTHN